MPNKTKTEGAHAAGPAVKELLHGTPQAKRASRILARMEEFHNKNATLYGAESIRFSLFAVDTGVAEVAFDRKGIDAYFTERGRPFPFIQTFRHRAKELPALLEKYAVSSAKGIKRGAAPPYVASVNAILEGLGKNETVTCAKDTEAAVAGGVADELYRLVATLEAVCNLVTPAAKAFAYVELSGLLERACENLGDKDLEQSIKRYTSSNEGVGADLESGSKERVDVRLGALIEEAGRSGVLRRIADAGL